MKQDRQAPEPPSPSDLGGLPPQSLVGREQERDGLPIVEGWKRRVFLIGAGFFFALGMLGVLLPVLPATPFLLLTSYFLVRSSPRLNAALLRSRVFGPILIDWQFHGGVRRDVKIKAIFLVVLAVAVTVFLSGYSPWWTGAVVVLATVGIGVIFRLPLATRLGQTEFDDRAEVQPDQE